MASLGNLTTYFSAESGEFLSAIEKSRGGLKRLLADLDPIAAATDRYNAKVRLLERAMAAQPAAANTYAVALERLRQRHEDSIQSMSGLQASAGGVRAGMQQLGFQLNDVAQGFASGVPPMQIFAQQGSQVVQALQLMSGGAKGILGFLGGPWGAILTAATVALVPFIGKLFDTGDAAADTTAKVLSTADAIKYLQAQAGRVDYGSEQFGKLHKDLLESEAKVNRLRKALAGATTTTSTSILTQGFVAQNGSQADAIRQQLATAEAEFGKNQAAMAVIELQISNRKRLDAMNNAPSPAPRTARITRPGGGSGGISRNASPADTFASDLQGLTDRLFPDESAARRYREGIDLIGQALDKGVIDADRYKSAFAALRKEMGDTLEAGKSAADYLADAPKSLSSYIDASKSSAAFEELADKYDTFFIDIDAANKKLKESNAELARDFASTMKSLENSLLGLVGAFKSNGNWFEKTLAVIQAGVDIYATIKGANNGKGIGSFFGGKREMGGPVEAGRAYVVGERRPELFIPNTSGRIIARMPDLSRPHVNSGAADVLRRDVQRERASQVHVVVEPGQMFDARVASVAGPISAETVRGGFRGLQRRQARRLA